MKKRIFSLSRALGVIIPKEYLNKLQINKDEYVNIELKGKKIIITKYNEVEVENAC